MRPRLALSLLALALPVPLLLTALPQTQSPARVASAPEGAERELLPHRLLEPAPLPPTARPAPTRAASRSRRLPLHRHQAARAAAPTPTHHAVTRRTTTTRTSTRTSTRSTTTRSAGYPWADDTTGGNDPWGFTKRQCVSYVAWRLDRVGRTIYSRQGWGSASGWDDVARRKGITVTSHPAVGSVAQWNAGESSPAYVSGSPRGTFTAGSYGHVAWVTQVYSDGSVQVSQYNGTGNRSYSTMRVKAPRFLRM